MSDAEEREEFSALKTRFANLYGTFGVDPTLEQKGVVLRYELENGDKVMFKIKRAGVRNAEWTRLYNEIMKPREEEAMNKTLTDDESKNLLSEIYARAVVIDWRGIKDANGEEVPFTVEDCIAVLRFLPELFNMLIKDAFDRANFREEQVQATAKNL